MTATEVVVGSQGTKEVQIELLKALLATLPELM
jgi:hypothetical protein